MYNLILNGFKKINQMLIYVVISMAIIGFGGFIIKGF